MCLTITDKLLQSEGICNICKDRLISMETDLSVLEKDVKYLEPSTWNPKYSNNPRIRTWVLRTC